MFSHRMQLRKFDTSILLPWSGALSGPAAPSVISRLHPELADVAADAQSMLLAGDPACAAHVAVKTEEGGVLHRADRHGELFFTDLLAVIAGLHYRRKVPYLTFLLWLIFLQGSATQALWHSIRFLLLSSASQ